MVFSAFNVTPHKFVILTTFLLTNLRLCDSIIFAGCCAGVAQLVEQLICNQQVGGSNPSTSSNFIQDMGDFPSGQRGQTVNLLAMPSVVRIHHPPPKSTKLARVLSIFTSSGFPFSDRFPPPHRPFFAGALFFCRFFSLLQVSWLVPYSITRFM